jgi:hypothetical protein
MSRVRFFSLVSVVSGLVLVLAALSGTSAAADVTGFLTQSFASGSRDAAIQNNTSTMMDQGRDTFRNDTFGSEKFFTDGIALNQAIETVPPITALGVGLKVDLPALQQADPGLVNAIVNALKTNNTAPFQDPQITLQLIKDNAVVGVRGTVVGSPGHFKLTSMGITCALCHSTVQDAGLKFGNGTAVSGIGTPLDGVPNRDLNVGVIISLAPNLQPVADLLNSAGPIPGEPSPITVPAVRSVLQQWGPGKFDAEVFMDGKVINPATGKPAPTLIPPAYGMAGVNMHTFTGWGSVTYWNAFVANLEMHGSPGTFFDPRLDDKNKFPIAAVNHFGHVSSPADQGGDHEPANQDRITRKLAALQFYQLSLPTPPSPFHSDGGAVQRGKALFDGQAQCSTCHVPPLYTEPGWNMHTAAEIGIDDFQASRSPDDRYRTTPLGGLGSRAQQQGGFYHDGRFATLLDVVNHYDTTFNLRLTDGQKQDLVAFLQSL